MTMIRVGQHGFTLVELLVSIAILAVLIGIFSTALSEAILRTEDAVCRSHLHGIAQSFHLYASANRGSAPDEESTVSWDAQLGPYAPHQEIFCCPGDPNSALSYRWRSSDESSNPRSGIRRVNAAPADAVLVFDFRPDWHRPNSYNVSLVDTSAHDFTSDQFDEDMERFVQ